MLDRTRGESSTLVWHVARANKILKEFSAELDSAVFFHGEHAYISPNWYPSKVFHGKAVAHLELHNGACLWNAATNEKARTSIGDQ